jgi:hypothetical protein
MPDLDTRIEALRDAGWLIETDDDADSIGERYWRGGAIRERRESLPLLVRLCEEHEARISTSNLPHQLDAHTGLSNL